MPGEDNSNDNIFHVPIRSAKKSEIKNFYPYSPEIKYVQRGKTIFCLSSLDSDLFGSRDHFSEKSISSRLESSLFCESFGYMYRSKFENKNIADCVRTNSKQCRCCELV